MHLRTTVPLPSFVRSERGSVTIDFTQIFLPVMLFVMMVVEIGIAFHLTSSAQKAAQLAARLAATRDPVHAGVWTQNQVAPGGTAGQPCYDPGGDNCVDPGVVWSCDGSALGGDCSAAQFNELLAELRRTYPSLDPADVTVTYAYRRLGIAGLDFVPEVAVTIAARESPVNVLSLIGVLQLRPVTASVLGEDMQGA